MKTRFSRQDILFGKLRPYFRKVARPRFDGICSTDIWVVRPADGIDQGFLFYVMASEEFIDAAARGSEGTRMPRAQWDYVSRLKVFVPPLPEQRAIARDLGALDAKIELNRRMSETLEAMARALFKSWFIDFDPVRAKMAGRATGLPKDLADLFPNRLADSELGEMPEGWSIRMLGDLCRKSQYGYTASARNDPVGPRFLRITDINKEPWVTWSQVPYCEVTDEEFGKYRLFSGDLLIARMADPGHGILVEEDVDAVFASYLIRFRPTEDRNARLLQYWLKSDAYWRLVRGQAAGTTRRTLNASVLSLFPLVVPPDGLAATFSTLVDTIRNQLVRKVAEMEILTALRDALLPKLISGEIRVPYREQMAGIP